MLGRVDGVEIRVEPALVGAKHAYGDDRMILVSPAMWDFIVHADEVELERLLGQIEVKPFPVSEVCDRRSRYSLVRK